MTPSTPKAFSYVRFSSPEQAKGDSLRRQTQLAEEYAQRHGLALDTELSLRDLGVSAFRGDNAAVGALGAFRRAIESGLVPRGSLLLVEALDRISRKQARKAVRILEEIVEGGVDVVTLNDGKRYTEESLDGADFLLAILLFMRGNEESATKAKRLRAAWVAKRERAARGEISTTRVPAWIRATGSAATAARNAKFELVPERAKLVQRMFALFLAGHGKAAIAERFNAERIPTWGAGKGRNCAKHWHKTYVFKILTNAAVVGTFTPHVEEYRADKATGDAKMRRVPQAPIRAYYPPVIDDETFQRARSLIAARGTTPRPARVASLVAGLAKCPKCGSTMTRIVKGPRGGIPKLVCTRAKMGAGCDYRSVKLPDVEQALLDRIDELAPPAVDSTLDADIDAARNELFHLDDAVNSLVDTIERSPSEALSKRLAAREQEREKVRAALDELQAQAADRESRVVALRAKRLAEALKRLRKNPEALPVANAALRECLTSIVVDYAASELRLHWRHGGTPTRVSFGLADRFLDVESAA